MYAYVYKMSQNMCVLYIYIWDECIHIYIYDIWYIYIYIYDIYIWYIYMWYIYMIYIYMIYGSINLEGLPRRFSARCCRCYYRRLMPSRPWWRVGVRKDLPTNSARDGCCPKCWHLPMVRICSLGIVFECVFFMAWNINDNRNTSKPVRYQGVMNDIDMNPGSWAVKLLGAYTTPKTMTSEWNDQSTCF